MKRLKKKKQKRTCSVAKKKANVSGSPEVQVWVQSKKISKNKVIVNYGTFKTTINADELERI